MNFDVFKLAVAKQFDRMQKHQLFRTTLTKDELWPVYLKSFPEGTNPTFRERTEHDCSCCRNFIGQIGGVIAIIDDKVETIWDVSIREAGYQTVANALAEVVRNAKIQDQFLFFQAGVGTDRNFEELTEGIQTWTHFFVNLDKKFILKKDRIPTALGEVRASRDVLLRSLIEITDDAVETVLELIAQNSLYRGEENRFAVEEFRKLKVRFNKTKNDRERELFVWANLKDLTGSVTRIRNTSIGTLLTDLSQGKELEDAVRAFETMVAPTNYKRPTSLITKGMIEQAKLTLQELGLTSALDRRFAELSDITVNNILFADRSSKKVLTGDVFDELANSVGEKMAKRFDKVEEVQIEKFISDILPRIDTLEVLVEDRHQTNLVSLIAPADPTAGRLFKWENNFSWSYNGGVADSIKERVKKAGGNVSGDFCCRLAWSNYDDLDFHMREPGGYEIYFGNRHMVSPSGGRLDVDMNAGRGQTREPVENIYYTSLKTMRPGEYHLIVNQFCKREMDNVGFEVEVDILGTVHRFAYPKAVGNRENVTVARFLHSKEKGIEIIESLPHTWTPKKVWGISTNTFQKANLVMMSPNFWNDRAVGNKHYFFVLEGCINDSPARGFLNEFLKEDLNKHRKVFEVLGSKMQVPPSDHQLSGVGFSSTQRNTLVCRVKGSFTRTIKIVF